MWDCAVCNKQIENDENTCYYCGTPKGVVGETVAEIRKDEIQKVKQEIENSPENIDKYFEVDYSMYKRDMFHIFNVHTLKIALIVYLAPIFGIGIAWSGFTQFTAWDSSRIS